MITLIAENLGIEFNHWADRVIKGNSKVDMESLIHQGMFHWEGNTYSMMMNNIAILEFPNPRKVRVDIDSNWLYMTIIDSPDVSSEEEAIPILLTLMQVQLWKMILHHPPTYL